MGAVITKIVTGSLALCEVQSVTETDPSAISISHPLSPAPKSQKFYYCMHAVDTLHVSLLGS